MRQQRGFLILIVLVFLVMISVLYIMAARFMSTSMLTLNNQFQWKRAYYQALGGLEEGLRAYSLNSSYAGSSGSVGSVPFSVTVFVTDFNNQPLPNNRRRIRASATIDGVTSIVEAIAEISDMVIGGNFDAPNCGGTMNSVGNPWSMVGTTSLEPAPNYCAINAGYPNETTIGNALVVFAKKYPDRQTFATENITPYTTAKTTIFTVYYLYKITQLNGTNGLWVKIWFNMGTSSELSNAIKYTSPIGNWTNGSCSITVPAGYTINTFTFEIASGGANGQKRMLADNVMMPNPNLPRIKIIAVRNVVS